MKTTLTITAAVAIIIGIAGWRNQSRITVIRNDRKALQAEATRLGIDASTGTSEASGSPSHRQRPDRETAAKATAAEIIAFAREMDAMQKSGGKPADMERFQERVLGLMERMTLLDSTQLKALIAEFRNAEDLSDETRQGLIGFSVMTLSKDHPQTALELFTGSPDLFPDTNIKHMVSTALGEWANKDPSAALEWLRANKDKHSELITNQAKRSLLTGLARNDPKAAFKLLDELTAGEEKERKGNGVTEIMRTARTAAEGMAALEAFRGYADELPAGEDKQLRVHQALSQLGSQMAKEGFESTSKWVASAKLSPEELDAFASGLSNNSNGNDNGKWIQWIGETLTPEESSQHVNQIVTQWTNDDYKAAGEWLLSAPEGTTKYAAVKAYARTVAPYEPETAAQWALTLPNPGDRVEALRSIHTQLKGKDVDAAAEFATKHGIKE